MNDYFKTTKALDKINRGDENEFRLLYNYYCPKIFRHLCFRVDSRELAEDIGQQVFYKAWQYIVKPETRIDNINAFLYRIANNLLTDHYRQSGRNPLHLEDLDDSAFERKISADASSIIDGLDNDLEAIKVRAALNSLKTEQKDLITWRYFDDLSISEIAKINGKSANAIYVQLHRAIKSLKSRLENV